LIEKLPPGVPKFDLDDFIIVEILESGIEVKNMDFDEKIPKNLRRTLLTEAE